MGPEIVVPTGFFLSIVGGIWLVNWFGLKKRAEAFATLRLAIEKGQPITPEAMEAMSRLKHPKGDLRAGILCISLALAFGALAGIIGSDEPDAIRPMLGAGVFPLFLGLAFIGLHVFTNDRSAA
jgi:hypothetical protein